MMKETIAGIIKSIFKVRSIITLSIVGVFCISTLKGLIDLSVLVGVLNVLLGYWFGENNAKLKIENESK